MKLKKIKKWTIITYFLLLIILSGSVPIYIYHKSEKLKEQSYNALDSFFRKQYKYTYIQDRGDITFSSKEEKKFSFLLTLNYLFLQLIIRQRKRKSGRKIMKICTLYTL